MKCLRLIGSLLAILLVAQLGACAGSNGKADDLQGHLEDQEERLPAYFEEIPADTFFFIGGSEPLPPELVSKSLSTIDTFYAWSGDPNHMDLLVDQMGGDVSAESLENLGISSSPRVAIYSVGTAIVTRFELSDSAKFMALIDRLEDEYEHPSTTLEHQGISYRRYGDPSASRYALLRTTDTEVVMATVGKPTFEIFLPYFVGKKKPAKSLADDNAFLRTVEAHGFKRFGAAYVDLEQILAYSTGTQKAQGITGQILAPSGFLMTTSDQCKEEYMRLVKKMPRLVAGFRHYDENTIDVAFGAELEETVARRLAATVSGTPGKENAFAENSLLHVGFGINLGELIDFLVGQAREVRSQPFQCEEVAHLNQLASHLIDTSAQIPPVISELSGANLLVRDVLTEWNPDAGTYGTTIFTPAIAAALRTDQPEALMYLISRVVPMVRHVQIKPDGEPVSVAQPVDMYEGIIEPTLVMTKKGLAAVVGPKMVDDTREVLDAKVSATSTALVSRLNLGGPARKLLDSMRGVVDKAEANKDDRGLSDDDIAGARRAISSIEGALPNAAWTATFTTEFNESGVLFSLRSQGEFEPDLSIEGFEDDLGDLVRVFGLLNGANRKEVKIQMGMLEQSLGMYYAQSSPHGYPTSLEQLVEKKIMQEIPDDPWDEPYMYKRENATTYTLKSKGPDRTDGTEDDIVHQTR
jgi:hypothetical protein